MYRSLLYVPAHAERFIGKAHERHVTSFLGAIGGAVLGHQVQRAATSRTWYDAALRLPNGALRVRRYAKHNTKVTGATVDQGTLAMPS